MMTPTAFPGDHTVETQNFASLRVIVVLMIGMWSCSDGDLGHIPYAPIPYKLEEPANFVKMQIPPDNPLTVEGIALGEQLFFDPILSVDRSISCSSCHVPNLAFTDGKAVSTGIDNRVGRRSAMSLINVGYYYKGLFWDGRVKSLEMQALMPVTDHREMGNDWTTVEERLRRHTDYPELFRRAFGIKRAAEIDRYLAAKALAQYERALVNYNSKFDRVQRGEAQFTAAEKRGWQIFFDDTLELPTSECGHCHIDPLFTTLGFFNNGIEQVNTLNDFHDKGRGVVTGRLVDNGKFRIPTLRNIMLTAPYMHDGRFATLDEVFDHYISGGHFADNLNPNVRKLRIREQDKKDLIAFLQTLTDSTFVNYRALDRQGSI
jgi:cytochrome c peroxidase